MKKVILYIVCIFVCISVLAVIYFVEKRNYEERMWLVDGRTEDILSEMCNQVFYKTKKFPVNINELRYIFIEDGIPEDGIYDVWKDPFNRNRGHFYYIPLYHRKNGNSEGYLLLSAGIDGKINHTFNDSIFIDEDIPLNLYDASDSCFHIFQRWFGKKDLLIFRVNGRELLKQNAGYPYLQAIRSFGDVTEAAKNVRKRPYFVMGEDMVYFHIMFEGKILCKDSTSVYFNNDTIWFKIQVYDPFDFMRLNVGDDVIFTGLMTGWENDSTINIKNCIPVDESKLVRSE